MIKMLLHFQRFKIVLDENFESSEMIDLCNDQFYKKKIMFYKYKNVINRYNMINII